MLATPPPADARLGAAYVLLELVVVPLAVLLLALGAVPGEQAAVSKPLPANVKATVLPVPLPPVSEPGAVLLLDPGRTRR